MFERFTRDVRHIVEGAVREAQLAGADHVAVEHLLLAMADDGDGVAGRALAAVGRDGATLRQALDAFDACALAAVGLPAEQLTTRSTPAAPGPAEASRLPLAPAVKRSLESALRVALERRCRHIDSGHVLLALLRDPTRPTSALLRRLQLDADALQGAVLDAWQTPARRPA